MKRPINLEEPATPTLRHLGEPSYLTEACLPDGLLLANLDVTQRMPGTSRILSHGVLPAGTRVRDVSTLVEPDGRRKVDPDTGLFEWPWTFLASDDDEEEHWYLYDSHETPQVR